MKTLGTLILLMVSVHCFCQKADTTATETIRLNIPSGYVVFTESGANKAVRENAERELNLQITDKQKDQIKLLEYQVSGLKLKNSILERNSELLEKQLSKSNFRSNLKSTENKIWRTLAIATAATVTTFYFINN